MRVAGRLHTSAPDDADEREADLVADDLLTGHRPNPVALSPVAAGRVQRQAVHAGAGTKATKPGANNYSEAAGKVAEAFLQTDIGKKLIDAAKHDPLVTGLEDFVGTLPGKIITGAAAAGAVSALAATHTALPAQIPDIPLDAIRPGLSVHITYEGAVDHPTKAAITFSYTPKGEDKKRKQTESERNRAETARLAAEQNKFRGSMTYPPGSPEAAQREAEQKAVEEYTNERLAALAGFGIRRAPAPTAGPEASAGPGLQLPHFQSPLRPKPFHVLDRHLELKPLTTSNAAPAAKKAPVAAIQRKAQAGAVAASVPASVPDVIGSPGAPLDGGVRQLMESRIGADFSNVRVHTDARSAASARAMQATAYTVGNDVVFAAGRYSPHSVAGQKLLAHELAHTIQQQDRSPHLPATGVSRAVGGCK